MRTFTIEERRARLGTRHALAGPNRLGSAAATAEAMVVLHATDPATVYLSALARMTSPSIEAVSETLYDDRSLIRILAMRRTLFVVPVGLVEVVERSSADAVAADQRRQLEAALADSGIDDPPGWLDEAAAELTEVLGDGGASARQLTSSVPRLATKIVFGAGSKWGRTVGATSRVLFQLACEGLLVRGQPSGGWTGRQYQWHLRRNWLGGSSTGAGGPGPVDRDEASVELVRRWLLTFGPATFDDLKWWTGWTVAQTRKALAVLDIVEVDLGNTTGLVLAGDLAPDPSPTPEPWAALLPALDPSPMGWKDRDWFLGDHRAPLFDRSGNIGPTIWVDGRIVGGWAQQPDGTIVTRLLEAVGADHQGLIKQELESLNHLLGGTVVKPSFPTPLQKELCYQYSS